MPYSRAKEKRSQKKAMWPDLRYGPNGECKLFNAPHEVPEGWKQRADEEYTPPAAVPLDREQLIKGLEDKGIVINPIWGRAHMKKVLDD
jgi:hypothetical protein